LLVFSLALAAPAPPAASGKPAARGAKQGAASSDCSLAYNLPGDIGDFGSDPPDQPFLRYEILISPITYGTIVTNPWYKSSVLNSLSSPLIFPCGVYSAGGPNASPATSGIGAITIKNAWMDATGTPAWRATNARCAWAATSRRRSPRAARSAPT
jgi:hypothetical protein